MFSYLKRKHFLLIIFSFIIIISSINTSLLNKEFDNFENKIPLIKEPSNIRESYNFFRQLAYSCATTSYDKKEIQEECSDGPSSFERVLKYNTFSSYISAQDFSSNGLNYVTSLLVDSETHHYGNFMNDGAGIIILYIIGGLMLLGWAPLLCCWRKRCCIFDDCLYSSDCCVILWHIITYFLAAAIFSFLIVVLCFGE
jgi:hypothetical protein